METHYGSGDVDMIGSTSWGQGRAYTSEIPMVVAMSERRAGADTRIEIARELHDSVTTRLALMLREMDMLRQERAPTPELDAFENDARETLSGLQRRLRPSRSRPGP